MHTLRISWIIQFTWQSRSWLFLIFSVNKLRFTTISHQCSSVLRSIKLERETNLNVTAANLTPSNFRCSCFCLKCSKLLLAPWRVVWVLILFGSLQHSQKNVHKMCRSTSINNKKSLKLNYSHYEDDQVDLKIKARRVSWGMILIIINKVKWNWKIYSLLEIIVSNSQGGF